VVGSASRSYSEVATLDKAQQGPGGQKEVCREGVVKHVT